MVVRTSPIQFTESGREPAATGKTDLFTISNEMCSHQWIAWVHLQAHISNMMETAI